MSTKFDGYFFQIVSNGTPCPMRESRESLAKTKKLAIGLLSGTIDRAYGRGDHVLTIWGARWVDQTSDERRRVGFPSKLELVPTEVVFTL